MKRSAQVMLEYLVLFAVVAAVAVLVFGLGAGNVRSYLESKFSDAYNVILAPAKN